MYCRYIPWNDWKFRVTNLHRSRSRYRSGGASWSVVFGFRHHHHRRDRHLRSRRRRHFHSHPRRHHDERLRGRHHPCNHLPGLFDGAKLTVSAGTTTIPVIIKISIADVVWSSNISDRSKVILREKEAEKWDDSC